MKTITALLISLALSASGCFARDFALGADISGTTELEAQGICSYDKSGLPIENTRLMRQLGLNAIRLRVWVNPKGNFCNPWDVLDMARRAMQQGMGLMIDFHYSDWWADPGKQNIPAAWEGMTYEQIKGALAAHTSETLRLLRDNGIDVKWIQIGNETTNGFLWPIGRIEDNFEQYAGLTTAGYHAAKKVYPDAQIIIHLDRGYDRDLYEYIFDKLKDAGTPWDVIGMSVYPYWSHRDQTEPSAVTDILDNIIYLRNRYGTDVIITEVGVEAAKPEEGRDFMTRLINGAIDTEGCNGVFYWAPEASDVPYPLGAFHDHRPTVIMDAFTQAAERLQATE